MFHVDMDSLSKIVFVVYTYTDDKLSILIIYKFDDKFHICMIYGI